MNNTLVSGDNKGMAAYMYESASCANILVRSPDQPLDYAEPNTPPGNTSFVAGFVQG